MSRDVTSRRGLLRAALLGGVGLGAAACDQVSRSASFRPVLDMVEGFTESMQRLLLTADTLAPEYTEAEISAQFRANGSTDPASAAYRAHAAAGFADWRLEVAGLVETPLALSLDALRAMPSRTQITRHDCVEGWSCIAKWTGVPLSLVLDEAKVKPEARFVVFECLDTIERSLSGEVKYYGSIDLVDARHPQTILAYGVNGKPLPVENGAPLRVRVERQLGYKMPKYIHRIELVDSFAAMGFGKGGYWEDRGYDWFGGM